MQDFESSLFKTKSVIILYCYSIVSIVSYDIVIARSAKLHYTFDF